MLVEQGDSAVSFFVVILGELEIVRPCAATEKHHNTCPGEFTGEVNMISDRRDTYRARVIKPGKVIELNRQNMMVLIRVMLNLEKL